MHNRLVHLDLDLAKKKIERETPCRLFPLSDLYNESVFTTTFFIVYLNFRHSRQIPVLVFTLKMQNLL